MLYRTRIHPLLPASSLKRDQFDRLWADAVALLGLGFRLGHIVTLDAKDIGKPPEEAAWDDRFLIYRRPTCRRCGTAILQFTLAGRDCFLCPKEQRVPRGINLDLRLSKADMRPVVESRRRGGRNHGDADE